MKRHSTKTNKTKNTIQKTKKDEQQLLADLISISHIHLKTLKVVVRDQNK